MLLKLIKTPIDGGRTAGVVFDDALRQHRLIDDELANEVDEAVDAVEIGQDSVRIAVQSIWIGVVLSVLLMVVAAFGVIPAAVGAGIQEVVDLVCILNALRALRGRGDRPRAR